MALKYMEGLGNEFSSEAIPNALPQGQNSPQKCPHDLIAEQFSTSAFTVKRPYNRRSWLYRIRPSVCHSPFEPYKHDTFLSAGGDGEFSITPNQLRWSKAASQKDSPTHFVDGIFTMAANGDCKSQSGSAIHLYYANQSMKETFFYNSDAEILIVPQKGSLLLRTEFGLIELEPQEIAVIPRGVKFQVELIDNLPINGYLLENYGAPLKLPALGPIGANGLANPRDFKAPVAFYEDIKGSFTLLNKFCGKLFEAKLDHSPLNVAAWHGNTTPYKYDLRTFNAVNSVSFDHPDPSIFTVLTSPTDSEGVANVDFVIFPPRWVVAENTFRPPYYHRNIMSEFMGLIHGEYDAKEAGKEGGFEPGGSSLHNCMTAHGPDKKSFDKASQVELKPIYQGNTMAFMFESSLVYIPSKMALNASFRQKDYYKCWEGISVKNIK